MQENCNNAMYPYKLFFYDCIWEGNEIIYPALNCNAICKTDITTGETQVIGMTDEENETMLSYGIYKWREYLILPNANAKTALNLFDLKTNEWSYITIDDTKKNWLNFRKENIFEYSGYLYIFSFSLVVLKVNIEKKTVDYLFYPDIKPDTDRRGEIAFIDNMVYVPIKHKNKIYKFDLTTEQWKILEVNTELRGIDTLCYDGRLFWMTGIGQMICSWDEDNNISVSYKKFPQRFKKLVIRKGEEGFWFNNSIVYGDSIYLVPCDANMIIEFDKKNGKANEFFIEDEWEDEEDTRVGRYSAIKYMGAKRKDNMLMMLSNKNKNLIFIDLDTKNISKKELKLSKKNGIDKLILRMPAVLQKGTLDLKSWVECISVSIGERQYNIKEKNTEETFGRKIYSFIAC